MDNKRVWSATACHHGKGYTTTAGANGHSHAIGGHQCSDPSKQYGVRCCCDEEPYTCGLSHVSMDSIIQKCGTLPHDCMFLITIEPNSTCDSYCGRHNLKCLGAWIPAVNDSST